MKEHLVFGNPQLSFTVFCLQFLKRHRPMLGFMHEILSLKIKTYFNNLVINLSFIGGIFLLVHLEC